MPFMVGAGARTDKLNIARLIETVLGAALIGAGAWFMLLPEIKADMKHLSAAVAEVRADTKEMRETLTDVRLKAASFEAWRMAHTDGE
jgi:hypothetical protein